MRQITSEHAADITKLLQNLVGKQVLSQEGQGRWTRYRIFPKVDSLHKAEISNNEWDELVQIAKPARQSERLATKQIESILLRLCENHWLTRKKIAELLNRNEEEKEKRVDLSQLSSERI